MVLLLSPLTPNIGAVRWKLALVADVDDTGEVIDVAGRSCAAIDGVSANACTILCEDGPTEPAEVYGRGVVVRRSWAFSCNL